MDDFRIQIKLNAPFGTPWQADTIFGHIAWQIVYFKGDETLSSIIRQCKSGDPPFIFSDGFPSGLMPNPLLPPRLHHEKPSDLTAYQQQKKHKKTAYVSMAEFERIQKGFYPESDPPEKQFEDISISRVSIDRLTMTAAPGMLYQTESESLRSPGEISIYARIKKEYKNLVEEMFHCISKQGFGRDKSIGMGSFEILNFEKSHGFQIFPGCNGFISLSTFSPAETDPIEGRWHVQVKFGKAGENISNPFKRPVIQFKPGAMFKCPSELKPFYGRVIPNVMPYPSEIVQFCFALPAPCIYRNE